MTFSTCHTDGRKGKFASPDIYYHVVRIFNEVSPLKTLNIYTENEGKCCTLVTFQQVRIATLPEKS